MRNATIRAALLAAACGMPLAANGADYARTLSLEKTIASIEAMAKAGRSAIDLQAAAVPLGLAFEDERGAPAPYPALSTAETGLVPVDLLISQLAVQAGAAPLIALRQAQAGTDVLMLESGIASLATLHEAATAAGLGSAIEKTGNGYVAHLPIAIWQGATLFLQPGETLLLNRNSGAFLLSAGRLIADRAEIRSTGEPNPHLAEFNPFVLVSSTGSARLEDSRFSDLGGTAPIAGLTILQAGFYRSDRPSVLSGNYFHRVASVALIGTAETRIENNVFAAATDQALLVDGGKELRITGNVIVADGASHGIKLTGGATQVDIAGNMVIGAGLNGIFVNAGAAELDIAGNLIARNSRSGVSVASADCIALTGNLVIGNAQSGISVRDSAGVSVRQNRLLDNGSAGISVARQPHFGLVDIASNELDGNQVGVKGTTTARLRFAANDFSGQAPRLFDGELVQFTSQFFDLGDGETIIDGLQLDGGAGRAPTGGWRPTSCGFEGDN